MTATTDPRQPISRAELIALLAMLAATIAFSIDAMLPLLPEMAADLSPEDPNRVQLVIATFVTDDVSGTLQAGDDAADVGWFTLDEVAKLDTTPGAYEFIKDLVMR